MASGLSTPLRQGDRVTNHSSLFFHFVIPPSPRPEMDDRCHTPYHTTSHFLLLILNRSRRSPQAPPTRLQTFLCLSIQTFFTLRFHFRRDIECRGKGVYDLLMFVDCRLCHPLTTQPFTAPTLPPRRQSVTKLTEMPLYEIWGYIEGDTEPFLVVVPPNTNIGRLRCMIKDETSDFLQDIGARVLILSKVCYF